MREVVKVQLPVTSTATEPQALVYNKNRSRIGIVPLTDELAEVLHGALKSFWWATWHPETTTFELMEPAPWQDW